MMKMSLRIMKKKEDVTPSDEKREKGVGFINSSFLTVLLGLFFVIVVCICSLFSIHQILEEVKLRRLRNL